MFYQHFQDKSAKHQDRAHSRIVLAMAQIERGRKATRLFVRRRAGPVGREPGKKAWHLTGIMVVARKCGTQILFFRRNYGEIDKGKQGDGRHADPYIARRNDETQSNDDGTEVERI